MFDSMVVSEIISMNVNNHSQFILSVEGHFMIGLILTFQVGIHLFGTIVVQHAQVYKLLFSISRDYLLDSFQLVFGDVIVREYFCCKYAAIISVV